MQEQKLSVYNALKSIKGINYIFWRQSNNVYEKYIDTKQIAESLDIDISPNIGNAKKGVRSFNSTENPIYDSKTKFNFLFSLLDTTTSFLKESFTILKI